MYKKSKSIEEETTNLGLIKEYLYKLIFNIFYNLFFFLIKIKYK